MIKWHGAIHTHNDNFLALVLCYSYVRCNIHGNWVKGNEISVLSLPLPVTMLLFQNEKLNNIFSWLGVGQKHQGR